MSVRRQVIQRRAETCFQAVRCAIRQRRLAFVQARDTFDNGQA